MIMSVCDVQNMIRLMVCAVMLIARLGYADTSEMSITLSGGGVWRSEPSAFKSDRGDWSISGGDRPTMSQFWSVRLGLGLSFTTEAWLRSGVERLGELELTQGRAECLDPSRAESLNQGAMLSAAEVGRCVRSMMLFSPYRGRLDFGGTYRPFDHWSPLIETSIGLSYMPPAQGIELIEGVDPDLMWRPTARGDTVQISSTWGWNARLGLGGEVRLWSRWGVRLTGWGMIEGGPYDVQTMFGLDLSFAYYRYIRLL